MKHNYIRHLRHQHDLDDDDLIQLGLKHAQEPSKEVCKAKNRQKYLRSREHRLRAAFYKAHRPEHAKSFTSKNALLYKAWRELLSKDPKAAHSIKMQGICQFSEKHFADMKDSIGVYEDDVETLFINYFGPTQTTGVIKEDVPRYMNEVGLSEQPQTPSEQD
ncbi:hypothetical protein HDV05_002275, partial [Chytridiales sp. JEL 0842]